MKRIIIMIALKLLFTQVLVMAQESSPIPTMAGAVTSFADGQSVSIDVSPTDHRTFPLARILEVVGPNGNPADAASVTIGSTVTLHLILDYGNLIVDRILLAQQ
jgi:hypothetical protein